MADLRVAIYTETFLPKLDGIVRILCIALDQLRRIDADVIVFAPGNCVAHYAGYPVISMPGITFPLYPELTMSIPGQQHYDQLVSFDPSVVHVLNPTMSGVGAIQFARRLNKPLLVSFHANIMEAANLYGYGFLVPALWSLHRYVYNKADRILATSKHMVNELKIHGFNNVGLWRRGVNVERFSPDFRTAMMRDRLSHGNSDKLILLNVGRLAVEKQVEQLIHVLDAIPDAHLALVGDGPNRERLEETFAGYPVTFTGYMSGDELSAAYASADIFIFPSSMFETFGLVVAEAMASGLPVVASHVGGVPELIKQGVNGFIFEVNDTAQMTAYVRQLAADPDLRRTMGQRARDDMYEFSWELIMDELFDVYREMISIHETRMLDELAGHDG